MRLIYVIDHLWNANAGTENQVFKLLPELSQHFDTELVCLRAHPWLEEQASVLRSRVTFFQIDGFRSLATYRNLLAMTKHFRSSGPCIVHTFFPVSNIVGVLAARAAGVRGVVASRRDFGEWMTPRYLRATRFANRFVNGIITNSLEVRKLTERVERFPSERIHVMPNVIEMALPKPSRTSAQVRAELDISAGDAVVVLVANYRPMKRHETAVRALASLHQHNPNVTFLLVGKDFDPGEPTKAGLMALARQHGVGHKLRFAAAAAAQISDFLAIADVGINCSQGEGVSNAIMEYMLAGLPVAAAASGGNPDLVRHEETGLLFPLEDHQALAACIQRLLAEPQLRSALTETAGKVVRRDHEYSMVIGRFVDYYRSL